MRVAIRRLGAGDEEAVLAAGFLFDDEPDPEATRRFLADPIHHLLMAEDGAGRPVGFVSGVETTHPDKGTEMFLYELGVDDPARRRGVGTPLVEALVALARERGRHGVWTATEPETPQRGPRTRGPGRARRRRRSSWSGRRRAGS